MSSGSYQHYFLILWIRLKLWRLCTLIPRKFWGDDCDRILKNVLLYVPYRRTVDCRMVVCVRLRVIGTRDYIYCCVIDWSILYYVVFMFLH